MRDLIRDIDEKFACCLCPFCLVYAVLTLAAMIMMHYYYLELPVSLLVSNITQSNQIKQLLTDWDTIPYTSLKVIDGDSFCPEDHPEEVIYRQTPEIPQLCTCKQYLHRQSTSK